MAFRINHVHIKAIDAAAAAGWFMQALGFRLLSDDVRPVGDRFIRCQTGDGRLNINFSGQRTGETLAAAPVGLHLDLEHFGLDSQDIESDVARLTGLGARLEDGPRPGRDGQRVAFLRTPHQVLIELIQKPPQ